MVHVNPQVLLEQTTSNYFTEINSFMMSSEVHILVTRSTTNTFTLSYPCNFILHEVSLLNLISICGV